MSIVPPQLCILSSNDEGGSPMSMSMSNVQVVAVV